MVDKYDIYSGIQLTSYMHQNMNLQLLFGEEITNHVEFF